MCVFVPRVRETRSRESGRERESTCRNVSHIRMNVVDAHVTVIFSSALRRMWRREGWSGGVGWEGGCDEQCVLLSWLRISISPVKAGMTSHTSHQGTFSHKKQHEKERNRMILANRSTRPSAKAWPDYNAVSSVPLSLASYRFVILFGGAISCSSAGTLHFE